MKSCPKCNRTFSDDRQKFCTFDGGLLIAPQPLDRNIAIRTIKAAVEDSSAAADSLDEFSRLSLGNNNNVPIESTAPSINFPDVHSSREELTSTAIINPHRKSQRFTVSPIARRHLRAEDIEIQRHTLKLTYYRDLELSLVDSLYEFKESWTLGTKANEAFRSGMSDMIKWSYPNGKMAPQHLLAGVLRVTDNLSTLINRRHDLTVETVYEMPPEVRLLRNERGRQLGFDNALITILDQAIVEARNLNSLYVGIDHILLAFLRLCSAFFEEHGLSVGDYTRIVNQRRESEIQAFVSAATQQLFDPYQLTNRVLRGFRSNYKIIRFVNIGGMGAIYAGLQFPTDIERPPETDKLGLLAPRLRPVCIKFLKPDVIASYPLYKDKFSHEIKLLRDLVHPNIIRILDSGETPEGLLFFVMDWIPGVSLEDRINTGPLSLNDCIEVMEQTCSALDFAHGQKTLHLDLKPSNIMVTNTGISTISIKVIDFGLAKVATEVGMTTSLTQQGFTWQFSAPEIVRNEASPRSDVFSLGATLYVMLTGKVPFNPSYLFAALQSDEAIRLLSPISELRSNVPKQIDQVIAKALQRNSHDRHQSVMEFLDDFKQAVRV